MAQGRVNLAASLGISKRERWGKASPRNESCKIDGGIFFNPPCVPCLLVIECQRKRRQLNPELDPERLGRFETLDMSVGCKVQVGA